ncbi:MAG: RDD family protein [Acidobacteriota bacterium]
MAGARYCGSCKTEQLLDVRSGVDATVLDYAGIGRRFSAAFLDGLITGIPALIMVIVYMSSRPGHPPPSGLNPYFLIPGVAAVIYQAAMLKARGQTLGKIAMNLKVVRPDGSTISGGQAWGREVSRFLLGFLYIVDYLPAFFTDEKKTVHDMLASTRVVNWV